MFAVVEPAASIDRIFRLFVAAFTESWPRDITL
jgi:hypothetical protein